MVNVPPWIGATALAATVAGGPRVLPTLRPLVTTVPRIVGSPTARMVAGYTGRLGIAQMNGVQHDIIMNPTTGMIDGGDLLAWWLAQPGGGDYTNGPFPRLRYMDNQLAPTFTGGFLCAVEANMLVFDPNNIQPDLFWPPSNNGFNAVDNTTASTPPPGEIPVNPLQSNTFLNYDAAGAAPAASNTGNHSIAMVVGGLGNIGTAAAGSPSQNALWGMNNAAAANRITLAPGDSDWTQNYGLGFRFNATRSFPAVASFLRCRMNRQVIVETSATPAGTVIDGVAGPVSNIRVNGPSNAEHYTIGTARVSSASSGANFLRIGQEAAGTAGSGASFQLYAFVLYSNALVTAADGDQRPTVEDDLANIFAVRRSYSYQLALFGSSSIAGYRANNGQGIAAQVLSMLEAAGFSVESYAIAGTSLITAQEPNRALLSSVRQAGVTKSFAHWLNARNDLTNGATGNAIWTAAASVINQFVADGWTFVTQSTLFTSITGGAVPQATFDAERAIFNTNVLTLAPGLAANVLTVDPASLPETVSFNDYTMYTDQIHTRGAGAVGATRPIATQAANKVLANV